MPHYLLDTNCFYSVSKNKSKQQRLRKIQPKITTSFLAVWEIARISSFKDNHEKTMREFQKRQDAMQALNFIQPFILQENPDDIVAKAFGLSPQTCPIDCSHVIRTMLLATSYEQAVSGVVDSYYQEKLRLNPEVLHEWKRTFSNYFIDAVVFGNEERRSHFIKMIEKGNPELPEKEIKKLSRELSILGSEHEKAKLFTIAGLSVRAGLKSENELAEALSSGKIEKFAVEAKSKYDNSLNSYITMYLAFQRYVSQGHTPERNALFDLEFFLHLDAHGIPYIFVTTEPLWVDLGKEVLPGRVINLQELLRS